MIPPPFPAKLLIFTLFIKLLTIIFSLRIVCLCQKYRSCLRKLAIVDDTLKKIGTMTDYQRLYTRVLLVVLGWFAFVIWIIINSTLWYMESYNVIKSVYIAFILSYSTCVNLIDDLIITLTLGSVYRHKRVILNLKKSITFRVILLNKAYCHIYI